MIRESVRSMLAVATKEFLHIWRDRRILLLILLLPPIFTLMLGYAFEATALKDTPALLHDADQSPESAQLLERLRASRTFAWQDWPGAEADPLPMMRRGVQAQLTIPKSWGESLKNGEPLPLQLELDGTDTTTAPQLRGEVQKVLGEFQLASRQDLIDQLPENVIEMGKQIPVEVRKKFVSAMEPWSVGERIYYNPTLKFIDYIMPGIVGLILQLLTVTLMACTIARERESGTLAQLMVSPLSRSEIVVGKVLPYLAVSMVLIAMTIAVGHFHFGVRFRDPLTLALICFLFLLSSLGMGLLISAFCHTQTQAVQMAVFYLLPVFPLSGAFAPLEQLPASIRFISQLFPLTHFCRAFRMVNLGELGLSMIAPDLGLLVLGAVITCAGAAFLLRRIHD
ncbi:MAG: drug efflux transport system permease protein [Chthoniobacter sp.]|jgi:ABC-2 type transport system permease protein|nr:drug efflux transport system permease protein [Chthoniobacter sp.]